MDVGTSKKPIFNIYTEIHQSTLFIESYTDGLLKHSLPIIDGALT